MPSDQLTQDVRRALTEPEHMSDIDLIIELRRVAQQYNEAHDEVVERCTALYQEYEKYLVLLKKLGVHVYPTNGNHMENKKIWTLIKAPIPEIKITHLSI